MIISLPTEPILVSRRGNSAVFEIQKLYPGYGVTLGNVLRRILLSSLPGAAITEVKIRNIDHEFTALPGIKENVVDFLLNIKKLRFRVYGDEPQALTLEVKGEREASGADLEVPGQVEVVSPEVHLATLTDRKAELFCEMKVERGIGYLPVEMRKHEKLSVGALAVDAIFTPVRTVNFSVENMRVGERTDYNSLRISIETDGTITPDEALTRASTILMQQAAAIAGVELPVSDIQADAPKRDTASKASKKTKKK